MNEVTVRIKPEDIWDYCLDNEDKLRQSYVDVAWTDNFSVSVTSVSSGGIEHNIFAVFEGSCEKPVYEEAFVSDKDARETAEKIINKYLFGNGFSTDESEFEEEADATQSIIENAVEDLVLILSGGDLSATMTIEDTHDFLSLVDEICSVVSSFGVSVYRPMKVFPKGKPPKYCLYPYDEYSVVNSATGEVKE